MRVWSAASRWSLVFGIGVYAGCLGNLAFDCDDDSQCVGGQCAAPGYCAFPDDGCVSGLKYGEHAGQGLGGDCVDPGDVDGGTGESGTGESGTQETGSSTDTDPDTTSDTSDDDPSAECGNDVIEPGEYCDGPIPNGICRSDCQTVQCDADFGDCNQVAEDGCEQPLDAPEACGACGLVCDSRVCEDGQCAMLVFVTGMAYSGNLGGRTGADMICQAEADEGGLAGNYKAWISVGDDSPMQVFTPSVRPYVRADGTVIATSWADLTSEKTIDAPVLQTLDAGQPPSGSGSCVNAVWSNTGPSGETLDIAACSGFSNFNPGATAQTGRWQAMTEAWTAGCEDLCASQKALYCFQQPDE